MDRFDHIINNGYDFEMSKYFNEAWDLFKQGAGGFVGYTILAFLIIMVISIIPFLSVLTNLLQPVLLAGFFIYCRNLLSQKEEFKDLFGGFKHFTQIILYSIVFFLFLLPAFAAFFTVIIPFELVPELLDGGIDDLEYFFEEWLALIMQDLDQIILTYLLIMAFVVYLYVSYSFAVPLIVDQGMTFWDAMETSRRVITKKFLSFFPYVSGAFNTDNNCNSSNLRAGIISFLPIYLLFDLLCIQ